MFDDMQKAQKIMSKLHGKLENVIRYYMDNNRMLSVALYKKVTEKRLESPWLIDLDG